MVQNHFHMLIKIPPKYSVAEVVGYMKGKSVIALASQFVEGSRILMKKSCGPEVTQFLQ